MKRFIASFLLSLPLAAAVVMVAPVAVQAVDVVDGVCEGRASGTAICEASKKNDKSLVGDKGILTKIVQTFAYVAGIVGVIFVALGGIRIATSDGDAGTVKSAKETIIYAIVGIIVAGFAQAVVIFVLEKL